MSNAWHAFKHRVVAWFTVWLDISDNLLYLMTLGFVKTRMGIQFRLLVMDILLSNAAAKIEKERKG